MIPATRELRRRYHELTQPVLIMAGTDDRIVTMERQLQALARGAREQRIPGNRQDRSHGPPSVPGQVVSAIHQGRRN